jgi:hypothetical protein
MTQIIIRKKKKHINFKNNNNNNTYHESNLQTDTNLLENNIINENKDDKKPNLKKLNKKLSSTMDVIDLEDEENEILKESRIAHIITESITQKVIILVMILLIIFPLLSEPS